MKNPLLVDDYFKILLTLACLSSSKKIHKQMFGVPKRADYLEKETSSYWLEFDEGRSLIKRLVRYCRAYEIEARTSHFWPLLNKYYQQNYIEQYEFKKEIDVQSLDFESLCKGIMRYNKISIGQLTLTPIKSQEATGHYGEEVFWMVWSINKNGKNKIIHTDLYSFAQNVFRAVNERNSLIIKRGPISRKLESLSRSRFDF